MEFSTDMGGREDGGVYRVKNPYQIASVDRFHKRLDKQVFAVESLIKLTQQLLKCYYYHGFKYSAQMSS